MPAAIPPCIHQATPAAVAARSTQAERAKRVTSLFAGILDAEHFRMEKAARQQAHDAARAGLLSKPDTFHSIRADACKATGMVYVAPFIEYPPANNVKMQHSGRTIWPGSRTKEADRESDTKYFMRVRETERKKLERKPVLQVAAYDEK